jgi:hypothetical protein
MFDPRNHIVGISSLSQDYGNLERANEALRGEVQVAKPPKPTFRLSGSRNTDFNQAQMVNWLVVWNMAFIFPYVGKNHPN